MKIILTIIIFAAFGILALLNSPEIGDFSFLKNNETNSSNQSEPSSPPNETSIPKKGSPALDLSGRGLKSLPAEIGNNSWVQELYLQNNQLTGALPAEIRKMTGLRILNASNNQLTGIPAEIGQLRFLETIDFSNNKIDTYPNEFANIKDNLKTLNLKNNPFSQETINSLKAILPKTQIIY